jgi:hypothetical protein
MTRSESNRLLDLIGKSGSWEGAGWILFPNIGELASSYPEDLRRLFSKHTGLSHERLWSPGVNAQAKPRCVSGFA